MQLTTTLTEERLTERQLHEDGVTVHSWRIYRHGDLAHYEVLLTLWVGDHRIVAQLQLRVGTTLVLAADGRSIALEAFPDGIGVAIGENGDHLGPICLVDNDSDGTIVDTDPSCSNGLGSCE